MALLNHKTNIGNKNMFGFGKEKTNEENVKPSAAKKALGVAALAGAGIATAAGLGGGNKAPVTEVPDVVSEAPVTTVAELPQAELPQNTEVPVKIGEAATISRDEVDTQPTPDGALGLPTQIIRGDVQRVVPDNPMEVGAVVPLSPEQTSGQPQQ